MAIYQPIRCVAQQADNLLARAIDLIDFACASDQLPDLPQPSQTGVLLHRSCFSELDQKCCICCSERELVIQQTLVAKVHPLNVFEHIETSCNNEAVIPLLLWQQLLLLGVLMQEV